MTKLHDLNQAGQALWFDFIRRSLLASGELQALVEQGVRGVTSNPAIFEKAIAGSQDYDEDIERLARAGRSVEQIYDALSLDDIQHAADVLRPVYEASDGRDGYVSLEVSPALADDVTGTLADARRLYAALNRPNVLIKVPATPAGLEAIPTLIREGVNINATLIFSQENYAAVAEAYIAGLEMRLADGNSLETAASVASVFVSRIDTAIDEMLAAMGKSHLQGRAAIANSKIIYTRFKTIFSGPRWEKLAARGARVQRPLWASTGTKNPAYSDTLYVDTLIGPDTVNTAPPATLQAFLDHGVIAQTVESDVDEARQHLAHLTELDIDLDKVMQQLQDAGVAQFVKAFENLLGSVAQKRASFIPALPQMEWNLGAYQAAVEQTRSDLQDRSIAQRIWNHDHTVWKPNPQEITNRLGWLHIADAMQARIAELTALADAVRAGGYTHALLLGMGGSSLAPEVFRKTFGVKPGYLDLAVLDSTDPGAVQKVAEQLDPAKTLFIVSTKSGGTVETFSFLKFFYNHVAEALGQEKAGQHFIAITDPGSGLTKVAEQLGFRATILNDPNIGGRYSALSCFGLAPAALLGMDLTALLLSAQAMAERCKAGAATNDGLRLGAILGTLAGVSPARDKVTFVIAPEIAGFGDWVEQLIAESTGKEGKGILPVIGEELSAPPAYGGDRLFVSLELGNAEISGALKALQDAGHPLLRIRLNNLSDLGSQFFLWEFATAVASACLDINPFDQPNVESAKVLARTMVKTYQDHGTLPDGETAPCTAESLGAFLAQAEPGDYVAIQAYIQPTVAADAALTALRHTLRDHLKLATTVGYGPRFLHSTGQLHKGDAGNGLFIQITAEAAQDLAIPREAGQTESDISFAILERAQALGDYQALRDAGRRAIHLHLSQNVVADIEKMTAMVKRTA
ncbi:MAG: bifunctional transaldolase/phosoglucose isomerase [Anaerolineae bacterium]|nr:bifunctional transaldolase/phosoglucose isomerase [Anaerolineae bacterium]